MRPPHVLHAAALAVLAVALATPPAAARTWVVRPGGSIQGAIDRAGSGDRILILPGEYREGLVIEGKRLTLQGFGAQRTRLVLLPRDAGGVGLLVHGDGAFAALSGFTFTMDELDPVSRGIVLEAGASITFSAFEGFARSPDVPSQPRFALQVGLAQNAEVRGCEAVDCADVFENRGALHVASSSFLRCRFVMLTRNGSTDIADSAFIGCASLAAGTDCDVRFSACTFEHCTRGMTQYGGSLTFERCCWRDYGDVTTDGGPVISAIGATTLVERCEFTNCVAPPWSSLVHGGPLSIVHCVFESNAATLVDSRSPSCEIVDTTFHANTGSVLISDTNRLLVERCRFVENSSDDDIINVHLSAPISPDSAIRRTEFRANTTGHALIAAWRDGALPIYDCAITETIVEDGTGAMLSGPIQAIACRLERNRAWFLASANLLDCDILGNACNVLFAGGRVTNCRWVGNTGGTNRTSITGCTIVANPSVQLVGSWPVRNCIVRNNGTAPDRMLSFPHLVSYCNTDATPHPFEPFGPGNINADPLFVRNPSPGPDQTWGTPDDDYGDLRLQPGSPCIDAADSTAFDDDVTTDLAGNPRFVDDPATPDTGLPDDSPPRAVADMGAFEFQPASGPPVPACDVDLDGAVDVRDLLRFLHRWTSGDPAADLDGDGEVDVLDLLEFLDCFTTAR